MSIRLLEHIQSELKAAGVVSSTPEFCNGWLGRSEGYIRTLRYHNLDPSVAVLSVCAHKLGYYADQLRSSDQTNHQTWVITFDRLKGLCESAIAKQSHAIWKQPERMGA
jgi:hypothetical protein